MANPSPAFPHLGDIFEKIAPRIGANVMVEPEWATSGMITFANGRRRFFRHTALDINPMGAAALAMDKDFAAYFMQQQGYPTVEGKTFFSSPEGLKQTPERNEQGALVYARRIGFPVIVKPNRLAQGAAVFLARNEDEFRRDLKIVFKKDPVALVQRYRRGNDYRVVVLDQTIISAYQRIPLHVVGDGVSSIGALLVAKQELFDVSGRDTRLPFDDERIAQTLVRRHLDINTIPPKGEKLFLLDNANLSCGGDAVDVLAQIHPDYIAICVRLAKDMGLRFCGVDLIVEGLLSDPANVFCILEINAAPGLDHYAYSGETQRQLVEEMYLKVLRRMELSE